MPLTKSINISSLHVAMDGRRLQNYKNKGQTTDELRKRREEEGVQIRKNKRNEMLQKRRLCAEPPTTQPTPTSNLVSHFLSFGSFFWLYLQGCFIGQ